MGKSRLADACCTGDDDAAALGDELARICDLVGPTDQRPPIEGRGPCGRSEPAHKRLPTATVAVCDRGHPRSEIGNALPRWTRTSIPIVDVWTAPRPCKPSRANTQWLCASETRASNQTRWRGRSTSS